MYSVRGWPVLKTHAKSVTDTETATAIFSISFSWADANRHSIRAHCTSNYVAAKTLHVATCNNRHRKTINAAAVRILNFRFRF